MQLLGGQKGEALGQVKADLTTEDAERPGAGAVVAAHAVVENVAQQIEILPFRVIGGDRSATGFQVGEGEGGVHGKRGWGRIGPVVTRDESLAHKKAESALETVSR
ncbi:hypothetical protein D3C86_1462720 [compost metagenome]